MSDTGRIAYDFAVLRVVPHVHLGAFATIGVIVHARTAESVSYTHLTLPTILLV